MEKQQDCGDKAENVKNAEKLVALQKVNRILNNKRAINKYHIQVG